MYWVALFSRVRDSVPHIIVAHVRFCQSSPDLGRASTFEQCLRQSIINISISVLKGKKARPTLLSANDLLKSCKTNLSYEYPNFFWKWSSLYIILLIRWRWMPWDSFFILSEVLRICLMFQCAPSTFYVIRTQRWTCSSVQASGQHSL